MTVLTRKDVSVPANGLARIKNEQVAREKAWAGLQEWFEAALNAKHTAMPISEAPGALIHALKHEPTMFLERVLTVFPLPKRARKPKAEPAAKRGAKVAAE